MDVANKRLFLASDSTVHDYGEDSLKRGWGEFLAEFIPASAEVYNHAMSGRSSKTYIEEGRLDAIAKQLQTGDLLLIQMGHNDSTKSKPERYTDPEGSYRFYIKQYISAAKQHGAIPILVTPVARLQFEDGEFRNSHTPYCNALKDIAHEENVLLIDLTSLSLARLKDVGYEEAEKWYLVSILGEDYTHFTKAGAREMARIVGNALLSLTLLESQGVHIK
ncbi:rhamnogalacturonan acetylesterase [Aureibacillus halotolerans]|uniref:Lysophospholipase L1-like esterase n=1 Tax=Aureibacillus halotolerans TaxID=1508390 RepID=A0A4R6UCL1_9BACI|nr:rhamnogalacturonan acetylesterase [Aureibacillus halotolerans]TDQ42853.1 lysophospholipase L1-like esterase [Aureibacillus halotolerans]